MNNLVKIENNNIELDKNYIEQFKQAYKLNKELELKTKEINQVLNDYMEKTGTEKLLINGLLFSHRNATTRTTLDTKKLKEELPDVYEEYSKTSDVASYVTVKVFE